jgi:hypothetical protein
MSQSNRLLLACLLVLAVSASAASAQLDVYLYNEEVVGDVDIGAFLEDGEVLMLDGSTGEGSMKWVYRGSAPDPYPGVHVWEMDVERLGGANFRSDGLRFVNHGQHWVKNKQAIVVWSIEVPAATMRFADEFHEDITLSLWVDWNQNEVWDKGEIMIREHINLEEYFPCEDATLRVHYMTKFKVPDVDGMVSSEKYENSQRDRNVVNLWVRGIISYDDPDVSPDGEQVFGEVEDYRVRYMKTPRDMKEI